MAPARTIVVGGGITGLSAAYELSLAGAETTLFEAQHLGGVIQTDTVDGCVLEGGPDSFLSAKPAGLELIRELGLGDEVIGSNDEDRVTYLVRNGRLVPMPDGLMMMVPTKILPMATTSLLSWGTKIRMGIELFRRPPAEPLPERTVAQFIRDHYGQETVDYLAEPLLSGVYGGTAEALSVNSVLPRFVEMETQYGSLTRGVLEARRKAPTNGRKATPLFQTLKGGLAQLTDALIQRIEGKVRVEMVSVEAVEKTPNGYRVRSGEAWREAENVIFACPAWQVAPLVRPLDSALADEFAAIDYSSSITLAIGVRTSDCGPIPKGFGFLVPRPEQKRLVACTFVGAKFSHRVPNDRVVLRCFLGGKGNEEVLSLTDDEVLESVKQELQTLLGWPIHPAFVRMRRWPRSMAQYTLGHERRVRQIRERLTALPGMTVAGNAYEGIGIPDCIRTGRAAVRSLLARTNQA